LKSIVKLRDFEASTDPHDSILIDTVSDVTKEIISTMQKVSMGDAEIKHLPRDVKAEHKSIRDQNTSPLQHPSIMKETDKDKTFLTNLARGVE